MKAKSCQNCISAVEPAGFTGRVLVCTNKAGWPGRLVRTEPDDYCRNFQAGKKISRRQKRPLSDSNGSKYIPLTQGRFAIVDADDYEHLAKYEWRCSMDGDSFYAFRRKCGKKIMMHREIMRAPKGLVVDHIDGNGLNNRKSNLRLCTWRQNACNRGPKRNSSSKYKGVSWYKAYEKWQVQILHNGRIIHLGRFDDEIEAAVAYDRKAEEFFGEFAYLNFPITDYTD